MNTPIVVQPSPAAFEMIDTFADILARNPQPKSEPSQDDLADRGAA